MRIESLRIGRYGHFQDVELAFEGDGVQMVIGHNEAGKTTLLEFVRELFFDFAVQNRYAFDATSKNPIEGGATLVLRDGRRVEMNRRKGNKNKVSGSIEGQTAPLDESGFVELLGGASDNLFRSIFAFGLGELTAGGESLDDPSVKSTLFGGGAGGLANPKKVIDDINKEANGLYTDRARTAPINRLIAELRSLPGQVRQKTVRHKDFEQSRKELEDAEAEAALAADEQLRAARELESRRKLADAFPHWVELDRLKRERADLAAPASFPARGLVRFDGIEADLLRLGQEREEARETAEAADREAAEVQLDARPIDHRAAIEGLYRNIESIKEARERLPNNDRKRAEARRKATEQLESLVPEWTLDDLRSRRPTASQKAEVKRLAKQKADRDASLADLAKKREGHLETLRDKEAELLALGEPVDIAPWAAVIADEADHKNDLNELRRLEKSSRETQLALADLLPRLNPPLASPSIEAVALPVPPREAVARSKRELDQLDRRIEAARTNLAEDQAEIHKMEADLAKMEVRAEELPTREGLAMLRSTRNDVWDMIRRKLTEPDDPTIDADILNFLRGESPEPIRELLETCAGLVRETDRIADNLLNQADAVAKHEQIRDARRRLERARSALDELQADREAAVDAWRALWEGCGFVPLDPEAMTGWLDRFDELRSLRTQAEEQSQETRATRERVDAFEARLRDLMDEPNGDARKLLAAVRERERAIRAAEQSRRDAQRDQRKARERAGEAEALRLKLEAEGPNWSEAWRALLLELHLPADWSPDLVDQVLRGLETARGELEKVDAAEADIAADQARLADFEPKARALVEAIAPELIDLAPEHAAAELQARLTDGLQARERKTSLEKRADDAGKRIVELDDKLKAADRDRVALLEAAGADSPEAFRAIAEIVDQIDRLDKQIDDKKRELDIIRGLEPLNEFIAQLESADQALLDARRDEAEAREAEAKRAMVDANQKVGSCREALKEYQRGSDEAALLQEQIAVKRAELAAGVDRYVPLVFARTLLKQAIQRFERDSRPEVLREASRIFQTMTGGRFEWVDRPADDDGPLRVRRSTGEVLDPTQLSTGAREQLYLAVRLAYVLHYCGKAEPLPIVMDDVMANFDDQRAANTLRALDEVSKEAQVIMFTCHHHFIEIGREVLPGLVPVEVPAAAVVEGA